ncbi:MAG: hypothetical protein WCJ39_06555 [bacterium]
MDKSWNVYFACRSELFPFLIREGVVADRVRDIAWSAVHLLCEGDEETSFYTTIHIFLYISISMASIINIYLKESLILLFFSLRYFLYVFIYLIIMKLSRSYIKKIVITSVLVSFFGSAYAAVDCTNTGVT